MNSSSRFIIFVIVSQWAVECSRDGDRLTIIAHGTNDLHSVEWAINAGANSVEGDLQFDLTTGDPTMFYHGNLCDCLCYELTFANKTGNVCSIPNVCTRSTPPDEWLSILLGFPSLSMIYIDSKTNSLSVDVQRLAGPKVIRMVESNLFDKGFKGNVVIGSKLEKQYLEAVATQAHKSVYASRIFLTYDEGKTDPTSKLDFFKTLSHPNVLYSSGTSGCIQIFPFFHMNIALAAEYRNKGMFSNIHVWTVDSTSVIERYYNAGARGFITNNVAGVAKWAKLKGIPLAQPGDATFKNFVI